MEVSRQNLTNRILRGILFASFCALAACETSTIPTVTPKVRPAGLVDAPPKTEPYVRSKASRNLKALYAREQARLLTLDLMRIDGGGPDTPFSADILARNFERIALFSEHTIGPSDITRTNTPDSLRRWDIPVRYGVSFGTSVTMDQRESDRAAVARYIGRLARITEHPISITQANPNFLVMISGMDDTDETLQRVQNFIPEIAPAWLDRLRNLPPSTHCIVLTFEGAAADYQYTKSVALIRAEDPKEMRRSCFHEELAQGLGLLNDSPDARPSIFNDDEEFALLTNHDEMLLKILYDPRLKPGMSAQIARPIIRTIAQELTGG